MTDPRVIELLNDVLGHDRAAPPVDLNVLGLSQPFQSAEQIRIIAKRALQKLELGQDRFSEVERKLAANFIKQTARAMLAQCSPLPASSTDTVDVSPNSSQVVPGNTPRPKLVAKPVDPAKLVARVVAPPDDEISSPTAEKSLASEVELVASPTRKRQRAGATAWLGWAMFVGLLLLATGAAVAAFWFRNEPWLTFQSAPSRTDLLSSAVPANPSEPPIATKPNDASTNQPPTVVPEPIHTLDPTETTTPSETTPPSETSPPTETAPPVQSPIADSDNSDATPPVVSEDGPTVTTDNESDSQIGDDDGEPDSVLSEPVLASDLSKGQRVVILRHLELALIATAAGQSEMAEDCLRRAKQFSEGTRECDAAVSLVQQLLSWRSEINTTVAARVPLLTNREELPVDDTIVSLISATAEGLVVRTAGQRREYQADKLPWSLARSVLEVTNSENQSEDRVRQLVTDLLRRRDTTDEAKQTWANELKSLLEADFQSTAYPSASLRSLLDYLEANSDFERLCPVSAATPRMPVADWAIVYREVASELKTNREIRSKMQDKSVSRFELEFLVWSQADANKIDSIVRSVLMIQQVALEQQDLTAFLDNLIRIEQLLALSADHNLWSDVGRALLKSKPSDSELLQFLSQLRTAIDGSRHGPQAIDGLSLVGKQLAQRLTNREQKQEWLKKF